MKTHTLKYRILSVLMLAAVVLSGCAAAAAPTMSGPSVESMPAAPAMEAAPAYDKAMGASGAAPVAQNAAAPGQAQERIVLKNASLSIIVPDPRASMERVSQMAEAMGGFVVNGQVTKQYIGNGIEAPRASLTIRVPAARLDEALKTIQAESEKPVDNLTVSSQDVTSEYVDLKSRQANLEAAEKELVRIMESATRTEDVMMVYNQLVSIREQIEVIKGQIKYYDESAAMSSISVELIADAAVQPIEIGGWTPTGVAKDAVEALLSTLQGLGTFLIWLVIYVLPVVLILFVIFVLPVILVVRVLVRRSRAKKVVPPAPASE